MEETVLSSSSEAWHATRPHSCLSAAGISCWPAGLASGSPRGPHIAALDRHRGSCPRAFIAVPTRPAASSTTGSSPSRALPCYNPPLATRHPADPPSWIWPRCARLNRTKYTSEVARKSAARSAELRDAPRTMPCRSA
ncbi:hypothetical protein KM043_013673 [Ampulex compressa]|nr:hypothetical protein KM043_013673 [Ampulex compressa]